MTSNQVKQMRILARRAAREMSDEEIAAVAGGSNNLTWCLPPLYAYDDAAPGCDLP